jgi:integrase
MSVISLKAYRSYFDDESGLNDLGSYSASWFVGTSRFTDNQWVVEDKTGQQIIRFDVAVAPNELLTDNQDLCNAVKLSAYLVRAIAHDRKIGGVLSGASQYRHVNDIINHVRWLRLQGVNQLSSVNDGVFAIFRASIGKPLYARLDLEDRLRETLVELQGNPAGLEQYKVFRNRCSQVEFNINKLSEALGVSNRILGSAGTPMVSMLTNFRQHNGFYIKASIKDRYSRGSIKEIAETSSQDSIRKELTSISKLYRQCQIFKDLFPVSQQIPKDYFQKNNIKPIRVSRNKGRAGKCTRDIPQPIFFELMDRAIRWVVDYAEPLLELNSQALAQYEEYVSDVGRGGKVVHKVHYASKKMRFWLSKQLEWLDGCPGSPYPISGFIKGTSAKKFESVLTAEKIQNGHALRAQGLTYQEIGERLGVSKATAHKLITKGGAVSGASLDKCLHHLLPTACLLVIYCFTARRQCEVESLQAGCCVDTPNGPVIRMYSAKVYQEHKYFPVTKLVAKAVRVLEALTEPVRNEDNQSLFTFPALGGGEINYWSSGKINEFAEYVGVPDNEGTPWQFGEHQFRRFFAMMFFYKFESGDLATLSWHLRHADFEMTAKYITDKDFRRAFEEIKAERIVSFAQSAANERTEALCGNMQKELGDFFSSFDAVSESRAKKMIGKVEQIGYILNFVPDGACFGQTPTLLKRSKCLMDDAVQKSSASRGSCDGCPNLLGFETGISAEDVGLVLDPASSPMLKAFADRQEAHNV